MDLAHLSVHSVASHGQTRTAWTAQEDAILRARVAAIGAGAGLWPEVAKGLPGRTSKSCAERWQTHLNPAYVRSSEQEFSDWEIAVMILAYARHGSNWLKVSEYLPMRSPQNIKNQVNYFNAKPEHVRDNRYLAARIELEDLLTSEPEIVAQRRERLREVLLKGQSALPAGALQAAYAAAKLAPPNLGNNGGSRLHPYARPTSLQASYGMQAISAYPAAPMQLPQQSAMQPQQQPQPSPPSMSAMNAMMLLAQAACGDDEVQQEDPAAAAAAAVQALPEGSMEHMHSVDQEDMQQASQHGVTGLQLPMIQTRPQQHSLLQQNGSGGSSSTCKQPGSAGAQMWGSYPSSMSHMMMMMQGAQGSPMASSEGHAMPAAAAAALAAAHKAGTDSPASTPMAALDSLAATAGLSAAEFAAIAAATAGHAMPRPSKSGSSQGTRRRTSKAASKGFADFMNGDDMSTSEEGEGEETGDLTPLAQRVAEAAAAAVSAATQQAVTATQQACQVLSMAQMLAQQAQQQEAKPAASDRSSQPSGAENGSEQQLMEAAVTQRLNNQHSAGDKAASLAAAAAAAAAAGHAAAHRLDDAVRHLLEAHYEKMQQLQQQLQQELQEQLASLGKLHTAA